MRYDAKTDRMILTLAEQQEQDDRDDRRNEAIMDAKRDHYIDMLCAEHDRGEHDVLGEEVEDCPVCDERALDEAAAQAEQDEEQVRAEVDHINEQLENHK